MRTPQDLKLPAKFQQWRPGQAELIEQIAVSPAKVFLLDSPPGTGKSVVGISVHQSRVLSKTAKEVLARLTEKKVGNFEHRCVFVTRTKQLQNQVLSEFPWAKTIMGKKNYTCLKHEKDFPEITADDCRYGERAVDCEHRGLRAKSCYDNERPCPYYQAKAEAIAAPLAVLNTSYFIVEANGPGAFSGADFLIIDEIDSLEDELMNQVQLKITTKQLNRLGLELPKDPHTVQGWMSWADALRIYHQCSRMQDQLDQVPDAKWSDIEIEMNKQLKRLRDFEQKINSFMVEVNDSWIFQEEKDEKNEMTWTFKPVKVDAYAERYIWRHAKKFLGMSGTIINPQTMASELGIENWDYARTESPFPVGNRLIYYNPRVNLTRKSLEQELPKLRGAVEEIIGRYPNVKILVHTTSFLIRDYLIKNISNGRLVTHDSGNRDKALESFKKSREPLVMLSPSFDRGVDLVGDLCRCIIICKVPYISLGDQQVRARLRMPGGEMWYLIKAARTIMQMTGRGVRSVDDYADTFILDRQFDALMARVGRYLPRWWKDAIRRLR